MIPTAPARDRLGGWARRRGFAHAREPNLTEQLIFRFGYLGIGLILVLGGLGLPIPEEAPIILAAVLTRNGQMTAPLAFASCLGGVLLGDLVVYFLGFFYGEKVLSQPLTRRLLTRQREAQIKGYFHRHGFKILVSGRFVPGFRTAAYLTAGILKLPTLKLLLTDLVAASLSTSLMFGLGYAFASQIQNGIREVQRWAAIAAAVSLATWVLVRYYRAQRSAGLPIGPPVLEHDDAPLPQTGPIGPSPRPSAPLPAAPGIAVVIETTPGSDLPLAGDAAAAGSDGDADAECVVVVPPPAELRDGSTGGLDSNGSNAAPHDSPEPIFKAPTRVSSQ
jgi:membrane protein DedA with SNARE-associated domain